MRDCCNRGPKIILYEGRNYEGRCIEITRPTPHLCRCALGNTVCSIRVVRGDWRLFEYPDFEGREFRVCESGGPCGNGEYPCPSTWCGETFGLESLYPVCE